MLKSPHSPDDRFEVVVRTVPMPADANANGDIFGGWLMSQMDIGGAILAREIADTRVVTVTVDKMTFVAPVYIGDLLTCWARLKRIGRTSLSVEVEAWVHRFRNPEQLVRVTEGVFTYVAIDDHGKPIPVKREGGGSAEGHGAKFP
ncbi:MAG: acyl-CoA thioesterase [Verrucomicrobia bacterium]|nr:acyl-CoA thioesterase [Verrucomicrobiota bacterium]